MSEAKRCGKCRWWEAVANYASESRKRGFAKLGVCPYSATTTRADFSCPHFEPREEE